jgi:hypothetical protein
MKTRQTDVALIIEPFEGIGAVYLNDILRLWLEQMTEANKEYSVLSVKLLDDPFGEVR